MDQVLGLLFLALYIVAIVALAAGITFGVIRVFPTERNPKKSDKDDKPEKTKPDSPADGSPGGGSLFRRSKRRESS